MSNSYFQFKQFRVEQERCAMKVTTDACIQGAWTPLLPKVKNILDIGAGTGLISLMLAQRGTNIIVDAIEYDADAAKQAAENIIASPWSDRISILEGDVCQHTFTCKYDLIISNPPFFNNSLLSDDVDKNRARHTISLSYRDLLRVISENLSADGYSSVLLPYPEYLIWRKLLDEDGWFEFSKLMIRHRPDAEVKRVVCIFSKKQTETVKEDTLVIRNEGGEYSNTFIELLAPFYLNL